MMAADAPSGHELCVFDFPGCKECPKSQRTVRDAGKFRRPYEVGGVTRMGCTRRPPKALRSIEKFIRRENLTLFKKRLAEAHTDAEREVPLKLPAAEEAREPPPKNGILKPR
jgi:hypothetical protein